MKETKYNIFCILQGKYLKIAKPVTTFLAENTEKAKLYLTGWQLDDITTNNYYLYKIGEIDKNTLQVIPKKIFITGSYENKYDEKEEEIIKRAKLEDDKIRQIEILFRGERLC